MANYYVNPNGSETYPFDTEAKGAKDVNRLYKYLNNSSSEFINVDFDNYSSAIEVMGYDIAPFPKGEEKVIFKTIIKEHEIMPIYMGEIHGYSNYRLPEGCILGTQNISLSVWSFKTVTTWDDSMGRVAYTNHIRKGSTDIKTFVKPFDISVSYYWVVDEYFVDMFIVGENQELNLEAEPEWHNNHGQSNWDSFFGLGYSYQKYASSLIGSISDGRTHIHSMSNYSLDKPAIALTADDIIYLSDGVEEESGLEGTDTLPDSYTNFNSFGYATLRSIDDEIKSKWTLSDSNYCFANLNLDNLDIFTTNYNGFDNPTKVTNCYFHDFSWCGIEFNDWVPYLEGDITCEISNNTFDGWSMIYDSEGKYNLNIFNNVFKNNGLIYIDDSYGTHNIYNNIFENNSYIDLESRNDTNMNKCVIANNTFTSIDSGNDAMYIIFRDNYGATMDLKMFNNVIDSGDIYLRLSVANQENIINFLHSNNCCPIYDYRINDIVVNPDPTEISTDPLFDSENLEYPLMLTKDSPCVNAGLLIADTPEFDIIGTLRDSQPDMGAFEIKTALEFRSNTHKINYAIEIYPNSTDVWTTKEEFGILPTGIKLITGRPGYTGNDTKFYSSNEIDIEGNDISNLSNENEYFEGLLTKDGLSGPSCSIDVETTTNLNLDSNFNFSIRNDTGFLNYLNSNEIILNNRKVKFWVIINNIFYSAGFGEISNISQSEDAINFSVEKSFNNIEKQIPNTYNKIELDEESGEFEEVVMPIVLGDVDHSMLLKEETKKLPIVISGVDKNITPAIYYDWFDPIHYEESWTHETGYYPYIGLYTNDKIFAENDPEIMGEPVGEYPYTYPNRKWLFVKYGEKAPKGMFRIKGNSASVNGTTYIHLEENLTNEDDEIINPSNFNSSLTINPLVYSYVHDTYLTLDDLIDDLNLSNGNRFYIYANDGYDTGDHRLSSAKGSQVKKWDIFQVTVNHPYPSSISYVQNSVSTKLSYGNLYSNIYKGNEKTWWFQIVDININTIASSESSVIIQNNEDGEKIAEIWNDDLKKYENIIDIVDVNSTENKLLIKGNKVLEDETIYNYKRLPFKLLAFGACVRPEWIWSNNGFSDIIYYNNQSAWNSGYFTTFEQEDLELVTNNKRNTTGVENKVEWLGYTSGMSPATHYSYIHAKFEVNKTIEELPDNVYFLVDVNRCSSEIRFNMRIGILQWYAYDIYGNLIYSNNSGTTLSDTTWVLQKYPTISHYNMFPNEFYADEDLNGDDYTMFDAAANEGTNSNKKQLKMQLNLKKSEIPIKFDNVLNNDIIKEFVVILGFYHEWLNPSDWSKFKIEIKQLGIISEEELHISDDDIFVKAKGERCSLTSSAPNAETNNVYTAFVHLLEDYCKIPKSLIDYDEMQSKRFNWNIGRTLTERKNAVEYFNELASNSFVQILPTRQGKIKLKVFDYFNNFQQPIITEKYYGYGTFDIYTTYSQIELCRELRTYKLKICYKTNEQIGTDEYSYFFEYSGDFEDNGINMLTLYYNGEVIYIVGYMNLGLENGFITILLMLNEQIHFVAMDYINTYNDYLSIGFPEVTTLHDNNIIIKDSLSDVEVTDISETYNNFKIKYNFDDNLNKFISEIAVNKVDELDEFPEESGNWENLVSGLGNLGSYEFCKFFWNACKESYNINGSLNEPQSDVEELLWLQNSTFSYPSGEKTAIKYFKLIVQWLTKQKHIIEYSVPINNETIVLELLDIVKFKDVLLTNGQEVTSFIVNKSINVDDDLIDLKIMFLPTFTTDPIDTIFETGIEENEIEESGIEENEIQEE